MAIEGMTFNCEVITPMFLAGADGRTPELRGPSIKGAMRFWWRAMNGHLSLEKLKEEESEIFGGIPKDDKSKVGKSKVIVRVRARTIQKSSNSFPSHPVKVISKGKARSINILEYLAYGTYDRNFVRPYVKPQQKFEILLRFPEEFRSMINDVLFCLSNFGGLGSRVRNGFGNIFIQNISSGLEEVKTFLGRVNQGNFLPSFTSFNEGVKLLTTNNLYSKWDQALAEIGKAYRYARGQLEQRHVYKKRQYIAAPIIADKRQQSFLDRHSKPYFLSVSKVDGKYRGQILYIPSQYCDGLEEDSSGKRINHSREDKKFEDICGEFNSYLGQSLEEITL